MSLLHPSRTTASALAPHLDHLLPKAAIPGGSFEVFGSRLLGTTDNMPQLPSVRFGETEGSLDLARTGIVNVFAIVSGRRG